MRNLLPLLCLSSLLLVAAGCTHLKTPAVAYTDDGDYLGYRGGEGLVASPDSPIPDAPIPVGFKPVPSKSSSSSDGQTRTVTHVYQGRSYMTDAVTFYQRQLTSHAWKPVAQTDNADGSVTSRWTKGNEDLVIHIRPGTLITDQVNSSVITVTLHIGAQGTI